MRLILPSTKAIELDGITNISKIEHVEIPDVYIFPNWEFKVYYENDYKIYSYRSHKEAKIDRDWLMSNKHLSN